MGGGGAAVDGVNGQGTKEERRGTGGLDILQGERQEQQVSSAQNVRSSHSFFSYILHHATELLLKLFLFPLLFRALAILWPEVATPNIRGGNTCSAFRRAFCAALIVDS